jgi:hypothetical protein
MKDQKISDASLMKLDEGASECYTITDLWGMPKSF